QKAFDEAKEELEKIRKHIGDMLGADYSAILDAQLLFLDDEELHKAIYKQIKGKKMTAEMAFRAVLKQYLIDIEKQTTNNYLRERAMDFKDVGMRVIDKLGGILTSNIRDSKGKIVVANDLSTTELLNMSQENIAGIILAGGGKTSHTVIVARALGIPMVIQVKEIIDESKMDMNAIIDGRDGIVVLNPSEKTKRQFEKKQKDYLDELNDLKSIVDLEAVTVDGAKLDLVANIEMPLEVDTALHNGAKGIGLYRTEFLYLEKGFPPTIEEMYRNYSTVVKKMAPYSVIIRTIDLGADKLLNDIYYGKEENPFLGWRGIRICLEKELIFKEQITAILKASLDGEVKIMLPMVSNVEEVIRAKEIIDEVKESMNYPEDRYVDVGIMIEVPSAALMSDKLAQIVDFFSIGSNDLTQYTLAVDRGNYKVTYLYDSLHPSVLKLIKMTIENAHKNNIWVGICGEMAGDPYAIPVLIGLGVDELSMSPLSIPVAKKIIRNLSMSEAKILANKSLKHQNGKEIRKDINREIEGKFISLKSVFNSGRTKHDNFQ
ncbi:MAG: phosphoenolpyruvate--protein phosphotransferase, partial [Proteobacteria bacterium]|nr:phosphoenolpyruvate--protein phosphotransferase [Pseudomonadota bacterium]